MDRVTLPKEVATSIKNAVKDFVSCEVIVKGKVRVTVFPEKYDGINAIDLETLIRALYIGYDVDRTPEEAVQVLYDMAGQEKDNPRSTFSAEYWIGYRRGLIEGLSAMNIRIEGFNT